MIEISIRKTVTFKINVIDHYKCTIFETGVSCNNNIKGLTKNVLKKSFPEASLIKNPGRTLEIF